MNLRHALLAAPIAFLTACGGATTSSGSAALANATPTYSALAMDVTSTDAASSSAALTEASTGTTAEALLAPGAACHPHLFLRTHEVVARVNRHLFKFLRHVEALVAGDSTTTGTSRVWEGVSNGVDRKFTVTEISPGVFTWKLEMEPAGSTTGFVTVFQGQIDRTAATGPHQGKGSMTLDLTALNSIIPTERVKGQIGATFDTQAASRTIEVTATDVAWNVVDPSVDQPTITALEQPRSGHYVYFREPGVGGSLKVKDQMVFLCPSNPSLKLADVDLVSRWYRFTDETVHGRSDSLMTGGQLGDVGAANVQGITCHQGASDGADQVENYWMMKAEDASGGTIAGQSFSSDQAGGAAASACDAQLGTVPDLNGPASDFDFSAIDFDDGSVVPFPNMK